MRDKKRTRIRDQILLVVLVPILIPLVLILLFAIPVVGCLVRIAIWSAWSSRGICLLYVHSNSPVWQDHIKTKIIPRLPDRSIILNWSERKKWRPSLAGWVFRHFGGYRDFNPLAVVFRPFRRTKVFRFHEAFGDMKHGRPEKLLKMEQEFFAALRQ